MFSDLVRRAKMRRRVGRSKKARRKFEIPWIRSNGMPLMIYASGAAGPLKMSTGIAVSVPKISP